ncbi:MAG: DUF1150 family protein, partial [Rhizobiales bacterium]|nr:DUF1150 family protein [Hyphomicrobiales bacterium]
MNTNNEDIKKLATISPEELAHIGEGALAYIREIDGKDAIKMLGKRAAVPADAKLFCLFNANGSPISISGTHAAAIGSA